jgi:hypothetical protein
MGSVAELSVAHSVLLVVPPVPPVVVVTVVAELKFPIVEAPPAPAVVLPPLPEFEPLELALALGGPPPPEPVPVEDAASLPRPEALLVALPPLEPPLEPPLPPDSDSSASAGVVLPPHAVETSNTSV